MPDKIEFGVQPLEGIMVERALKNSDLVGASTEQLTHKMVQKGRKGRRLTLKAQMKIVKALNALSPEKKYSRGDLFSY